VAWDGDEGCKDEKEMLEAGHGYGSRLAEEAGSEASCST
jgi:hypothetical protein